MTSWSPFWVGPVSKSDAVDWRGFRVEVVNPNHPKPTTSKPYTLNPDSVDRTMPGPLPLRHTYGMLKLDCVDVNVVQALM